MPLTDNPFYVLSASVRDSRQRIVELAEEKSLHVDPSKCAEARTALINPRLRIKAEIGWLPGVSPKRAVELTEKPLNLSGETKIHYGRLLPLTACNVLADALQATPQRADRAAIKPSLEILLQKFGEIEPSRVLQVLNEDREVAGFAPIQSEDVVEQALTEHKSYLVRSLLEGLNRLPEPDAVLTQFITQFTNKGDLPTPPILEEFTARYEVEVKQHLDRLGAEIAKLVEGISSALKKTNGKISNLSDHVKFLEESLREWNRLAQPIQMVAKTRGVDEETSVRLAAQVRDLAILMANDYSLHADAKHLTVLLGELFVDLTQLSSRIEEDISALDGILSNKEKSVEEKEQHAKDIALDLMIGNDRLTISAEKITYRGNAVSTDEVSHVRWGVFKQYMNGIRTSRSFMISLGDGKREIEIECVRFMESEQTVLARYQLILEKLWSAVCSRLMVETLNRLAAGEKIKYGPAIVDKGGIVLPKKKFMSFSSEPTYYPWEDLSISTGAGFFQISATNDNKASVQLEYRVIDNVHIFESVMRFLWKDGNHLKLKNGGFK